MTASCADPGTQNPFYADARWWELLHRDANAKIWEGDK